MNGLRNRAAGAAGDCASAALMRRLRAAPQLSPLAALVSRGALLELVGTLALEQAKHVRFPPRCC